MTATRNHLWWHYPKTDQVRCLCCDVLKTRANYLTPCARRTEVADAEAEKPAERPPEGQMGLF